MTLEELVEKETIREMIDSLFIAVDEKDWETARSCFANEVHFDITSMADGYPGTINAEQIVGGWEDGLKDIEKIHHQSGNYKITLNGESAEVFCYAIAYHYKDLPSGKNTRTFVGSYEYGLMKEESEWKISSFKYNLKFMDGNLDLD